MIRIIREDYSDCPYYAGTGDKTCQSGCWTEPVCVTNEPEGGWPEVMDFDTEEEAIRFLGEEQLYYLLNQELAEELTDPDQ